MRLQNFAKSRKAGWLLLLILLSGNTMRATADAANAWKTLAPGIDLRWHAASEPSAVGDSRIAVVKIDPALWELQLAGRYSSTQTVGKTAREWAGECGFAVAINAGMFGQDYHTHLGYMEFRGQVNSGTISHYQSVAAFDPHGEGSTPPFRIFDLDASGVSIEALRREYASLLQNLRLIKKPGLNRWSRQDRKWSEAALGEDRDGRILFIFSRSPFSMHDLNEELLAAKIGLTALQHLEGGPEAQLYIKIGTFELEMFGSFETSFNENDTNPIAWPIPNVLGVKRRTENIQ